MADTVAAIPFMMDAAGMGMAEAIEIALP